MYIGTFHSIALRIMKELPEYKESNRRILDSFETTYMICRNIDRFRYLTGFKEYFPDSLGVWKQAMGVGRYVSRLLEELADIDAMSRSKDNDAALLGKMVTRYREILEENNAMDFSTILTSLYYALKKNSDDLKYLNKRIRYIMVDEYQDTNFIQEQFVFMLGGGSKNICVVGDDDQGLYRFRGATIRNILEFPHKFDDGECRQIYLDINYRSEPGIIDFCREWMDDPVGVYHSGGINSDTGRNSDQAGQTVRCTIRFSDAGQERYHHHRPCLILYIVFMTVDIFQIIIR